MEEIYFELANVILVSKGKINEKQTIHYDLIVSFFHNFYTSKIENLRDKLRYKESCSKSIQSIKNSLIR